MPLSRRNFFLTAGALSLAAIVPLSACTDGSGRNGGDGEDGGDTGRARPADGSGVSVVSDDPTGLATSRAVFDSADTAVLVTAAASAEQLSTGCDLARAQGVPVLVEPTDAGAGELADELERLGVTELVVVGGFDTSALAGVVDDGDVEIFEVAGDTGDTGEPAAWPDGAATGVSGDDRGRRGVALAAPASSPASAATAAAAGLSLLRVAAADPRSTDESIDETIDALDGDGRVVALGDAFGDDETVQRRIELAKTVDARLPGGGQVLFPGRQLIALYGHANDPALGAMGEQPVAEAVSRAERIAEEYSEFTDVPVIPSFEIITTVAAQEPGPSGNYTNYTDAADIEPWIDAIAEAGGYAIIDIQPGRESMLTQIQHYADLIKRPEVGVALDPEWRLGPDEEPMNRVGHVYASEINEVADWLDELVAEEQLPQKLLMLHQFQLQMIRNREDMTTGTDNVGVAVHADGHGDFGTKMETWEVVRRDLDPGIALGWKNFHDEDSPMLTPAQTMDIEPVPDIVSYQ